MHKVIKQAHNTAPRSILEAIQKTSSICILGKPDGVSFYSQDVIPYVRLAPNTLFVFGSNVAGIHGCGAALQAKLQYGACQYCGQGWHGGSYAIPTKNSKLKTLPLSEIKKNVQEFIKFTKEHPELSFYVTPIGTGYAGLRDVQIAPMFKGARNCWFPARWRAWLYSPDDSKQVINKM